MIPVVLLSGGYAVKTRKFQKPVYIGDPINTVKIMNTKGADELFLLDIRASEASEINFGLIADIASEAFMPVAYGGGIQSVEDAERVLELGVEKVVINLSAFTHPGLMAEIASRFGNQALVGSIDVSYTRMRRRAVVQRRDGKSGEYDPIQWGRELINRGCGELLLTSVEREGTRMGYDLDLIAAVSEVASVPVVANGGAGCVGDLPDAIDAGASAVAAGSMFVFHGASRAVLISYPTDQALTDAFQYGSSEIHGS